jgi:hypothetical protein
MHTEDADCSVCRDLCSTGAKKKLFFPARKKFAAPGTIRLIRCIRGIRVPP